MPHHVPSQLLFVLALLSGAPRAGAEDRGAPPEQPPETIVVFPEERDDPGDLVGEEERRAGSARALDEPAFVTVVRTGELAGETRSVAEVLARQVGASVRSLGGLGAFSALSVRGHAPGHTQVLVDGVPLSRLGSTTVDLGRFELDSFSELELYRGGVPVEHGGAGLGGALNLKTRLGPVPDRLGLKLSAGAGSFGARHLRGRWLGGEEDGSRGHHLSLGYAGADGDFTFFDDNGTNLNLADDSRAVRANNGYEQVDGAGRLRAEGSGLSLEAGGRFQWREQGVPGRKSAQSATASLATLSQLLDASISARPRSDLALSAAAFGHLERQRYLDLDGEIGLGAQNRRYWSLSSGARGALRFAAGEQQVLAAGLEARLDYFSEKDLVSEGELPRAYGLRLATAVTAADEIRLGARGRSILMPALRLDLQRTLPIADSSSGVIGPMDLEPTVAAFLSPRLSARLRLAPGLSLKGNAGRYFRAPTVFELFGDRGWVVGNPDLAPETGLSADLGLVLAPPARHGPADRLYLEAALFGARTRDTIALVPTAAGVTRARNLGGALTYGAELLASGRMARTSTLTAGYTFLDSRQRSSVSSFDGKRLPQRPRHQLYWRVDVARRIAGRLLVLWADATVESGSFLDPANREPIPLRRLVGAGVKLEPHPGLLVGVAAKNLADERVEQIDLSPPPRPDLTRVPRAVSDFLGYPLPGRAFYLTFEWET